MLHYSVISIQGRISVDPRMRVKKRNLLSEGQLTELHREVADSDGRKSYEVVIIGRCSELNF